MRLALAAITVVVLLSPGLGEPDEPEPTLDAKALKALKGIAEDLGKAGLIEEAKFLAAILTDNGLSKVDGAALLSEVERRAAKAGEKAAERAKPRILRRLAKVVGKLATGLEHRPDEARKRMARLLLRLNGSHEGAHAVLGHEKTGNRWLTPEELRLQRGRSAFQDVLRRARRLEVPIKAAEADPLIADVTGKPGVCRRFSARGGTLELHAAIQPHRLSRILKEGLRTLAVAQWMLDGELRQPRISGSTKYLLLQSKADYQATWRTLRKRDYVSTQELDSALKLGLFYFSRAGVMWVVAWNSTEPRAEALIFWFMSREMVFRDPGRPAGSANSVTFGKAQPCLRLGLCKLVALAFLGADFGNVTWIEEGDAARRRSLATPAEIRSWRIRMYPNAGLAGHRRLMAYLARDGKDPPWARSMEDQIGKIQRDNVVKSTTMVQFLSEHGPLGKLFFDSKVVAGPERNDLRVRAMEGALEERLDSLEARWRVWILGETPLSLMSMLSRTVGDDEPVLSAGEAAVIKHLNKIRGRASLDSVSLDRELSMDAGQHASYLDLHRDQLTRWPDAHEEYPDREGYSPGGCWAGLHGVIASGHDSPAGAIDCWMGTFYHRLPLLHPGVIQVGWGEHAGVAVLDACSLVIPVDGDVTVVWPYDGAREVPLGFQPELPNPVPGEDQSQWGYPVTVQRWRQDGGIGLVLSLTLHTGSKNGPIVDCHFSAPQAPTNPELVPHGTWCLIPKATLKPGTTYWVRAKFGGSGGSRDWKFKTGR